MLLGGFRLGSKTIWPQQGRIESPAGTLRLEPRVMDLLVYLAASPGQVVSRDAIIRDVWRGTLVTDDVISRSIYLIRKALSEPGDEDSQRIIQTIPKRGYRLIIEVAPGAAAVTETPPPSEVLPPGEVPLPSEGPPPMPIGTRRSVWLAAAALTVIAATAVYAVRRHPEANSPAAVRSFLVLPFATTGSGVGGIDLGSALSDDLRDQLGAVQNLRVIGRRTALRAQSTHESYADMVRKWAIDAVLEGNVETAGSDVQATLKLVSTNTGGVIFEKMYRATYNDTPALSGQVAHDIAQALQVRFPRGRDSAAHLPPADAYRLYLQGRYYSMQNTPGGFQQAHDYFEQATKIDADFAPAWIALAITDMLRVDFGGRSPAAATAEAEPSLARAQLLDPGAPELLAVRGLVALYNRRYEQAADALRQATSLRPSYGQAYVWLGRVFLAQGEVRRAASALQRAYDLDPESTIAALNLGLVQDSEGKFDAAEQILGRAISADPTPTANLEWAFAHVEAQQGKLEAAGQSYHKAIDLGAEYAALYAQYAMLLAETGSYDEAVAAIAHGDGLDATEPSLWAGRVMVAVLSNGEVNPVATFAAAGSPDSPWPELARAKLLLWHGDAKAAVRLYQESNIEARMVERASRDEIEILGGPAAFVDMACAYRMIGDAAHARRDLELAQKILAADRARGVNPLGYDYLVAAVAAQRDDEAQAVSLLRFAAARGWRDYAWFKGDPNFARLSNRSKAVVMGLPLNSTPEVSLARPPVRQISSARP
jgi:DNA-binding winged helix-turn-helix (wHTH) protein/tetratricopeptide (TPR) repeat protein